MIPRELQWNATDHIADILTPPRRGQLLPLSIASFYLGEPLPLRRDLGLSCFHFPGERSGSRWWCLRCVDVSADVRKRRPGGSSYCSADGEEQRVAVGVGVRGRLVSVFGGFSLELERRRTCSGWP